MVLRAPKGTPSASSSQAHKRRASKQDDIRQRHEENSELLALMGGMMR
jgi:hypothetical protein